MRSRWPCWLTVCVLAALVANVSPAVAQSVETIGIYYIGPDDAIAHAIDRSNPYLVRVEQPDLAQVVIINNPLMTDTVAQSLEAWGTEAQQGQLGMVIFCGDLFPQTSQDLRNALGVSTFGMERTAVATEINDSLGDDPLADAITWASAPELGARTVITNPNLLQPVVTTRRQGNVIQRVRGREGVRVTTQTQTLVVGPWLDHPTNTRWTQWAYFDYLIYRLIADASGASSILAFADYPRSPTPQRAGRWLIVGAGIGLMLGAGIIYTTARRRLYLDTNLTESWRRISLLSSKSQNLSEWHRAGFHRPLAGFLALLPWSLILFIPLAVYTHYLLPDILTAGTSGLDLWDEVTVWTAALWLLIDAGMGVAAVQRFIAHFVHSPQRAVRFLQFYVWWQMLSGAIQIGLVCIVTALALPATGLAHLTYPLLARALLQLPGFFGIFSLAFRARQRFGVEQFLNLLTIATVPIFQTGSILLLRQLVANNTNLSESVAVVFGLATGIMLAQTLTFSAGALLHRRAGHAISALFLPTFDSHTFYEMITFGFPWAIAAAIPALSALLQLKLASTTLGAGLIPTELGLAGWQLLILITTGFEVLLTSLYQSLMPALTEAAVLQTQTLLKYYISQGARYGAWFSFFLLAALSALGVSLFPPVLARQAGPLELWLLPMLLWGALRWTAWLPDRMLEAAGHPTIIVRLTLIEHIIRIGGTLILTPLFGTGGLIIAYLAGLILRMGPAMGAAGRHLIRGKLYVWQSLLAPIVAAFPIYFALRAIRNLPSSLATDAGWLGMIAVLLLAIPVYTFLTALLGGWDTGSLLDLERATAISSVGYPLAWLMLQAVRLGAQISPLHGRFSVGLYVLAQEEAMAVTAIAGRDRDLHE